MPNARLTRRNLLDPREPDQASARPIADAVNIPLSQWPRRTHELPPRRRVVRLAARGSLARAAVDWLARHGRRGVVASEFRYGRTAPSSELGRLWEPNPLLAGVLPRLRPGRALDLACGSGRDAVYMAAGGWEVTAVDVLPDALARGRDLARRCAAAIGPIRWLEHDLEGGVACWPDGFDLVVVIRYLHRPLLGRLAEWLRPGGSLVCEAFTRLHRARYGRPARDARVLRPGELPRLLEGFETRHYSEGWHEGMHTARAWALRPGH